MLELAERAKAWVRSGLLTGDAEVRRRAPELRVFRLWARAALFVLTIVCVAALYGLFHLTVGLEGWLSAALCLALAEFLIRRSRFFRTGVEEALWIGGLFALIIGLPGPPKNEGLLLFGLACLIAGLRLLQPLFLALSPLFGLIWLMTELDTGEAGGWLALAISVVATFLLRQEIRRPSIDWMLALLVAGSPLLAWIAFEIDSSITSLQLAAVLLTILVLVVTGAISRLHPPLFGAMLVAVPAGFELGERFPMRADLKMLLAGLIVFGCGVALDRLLRQPPRGVTSRRLVREEGLELLEIAAVTPLAPPATPGPDRGGEFGGAGASDEW